MKLTDIKGIGPKTEELFHKIGVETAEDLMTGDMPLVRITGSQEYDLIGELAAE